MQLIAKPLRQTRDPSLPLPRTVFFRSRFRSREGVTLIEVLIATVLLLVSMMALGTQASVGIQAAERVELQAVSTMLCQSILEERIATNQTTEQLEPRSIDSYPRWQYTVKNSAMDPQHSPLHSHSHLRLQMLSVTVWRSGPKANISRVTLVQIVQIHSASLPGTSLLREAEL